MKNDKDPDQVLLDEPYPTQKKWMEKVMKPSSGKIVIFSTPTGENWLYKYYNKTRQKIQEIVAIDPKDLKSDKPTSGADAMLEYNRQTFEREYLCKFVPEPEDSIKCDHCGRKDVQVDHHSVPNGGQRGEDVDITSYHCKSCGYGWSD